MAAPYKSGGRIQPHRERAKAERLAALAEMQAGLAPLEAEPPEWLTDEAARAAWMELWPLLPHHIVRKCDAPLFAITCTLAGRERAGTLSTAATSLYLKCLEKMGLSPRGRQRLAKLYPPAPAQAQGGGRFARFADPEDAWLADFEEAKGPAKATV